MQYFVVMIDYGRRGREAIVDPEITRREVISRVASGEYKNISFIHEIADTAVDDVTAEILAEAAVPEIGLTGSDLQASHFDHARDLAKHEPVLRRVIRIGLPFAELADCTAFARRRGTQLLHSVLQSGPRAADTPAHLAQVARVFAAMRPFMTGLSHVNYCDLDLQNWQTGIGAHTFPGSAPSERLAIAPTYFITRSVPVGSWSPDPPTPRNFSAAPRLFG